jgi:putative transposase
MSRKRFTPEPTFGKVREAEETLAQGRTAAQLCRTLGLAEPTFSPWGHKYAGLTVEQGTSLKHFCDQLPFILTSYLKKKLSIRGIYREVIG